MGSPIGIAPEASQTPENMKTYMQQNYFFITKISCMKIDRQRKTLHNLIRASEDDLCFTFVVLIWVCTVVLHLKRHTLQLLFGFFLISIKMKVRI